MEKKYLTIDEQISLLKDKKLLFKSEKKAKVVLQEIGYYKLINAYRSPFIQTSAGKKEFINNVYFEDLYNLYDFDRKLKTIVFEAATSLEIGFKSYLSTEISKNYGIKDTDYMKEENFVPDFENPKLIKFKTMKECFYQEINKQYDNNHPAIVWYKERYGFYPFWIVDNILSLGTVSKIYSKLKLKNKIEIAKKYKIRYDYLEAYIKHINLIRNICAHNDLLYRFKSHNYVPQIDNEIKKIYKVLDIKFDQEKGRFERGTNDFLSTIIIFKILLSTENYNLFKTQLSGLMNKLSKKMNESIFKIVKTEMGINELKDDLLKLDTYTKAK